MKYSPDQQVGIDTGIAFMHNTERFLSIIGPAGSGKTTLLRALLDYADVDGVQTILTATTHEAGKVIQRATGRHATTIHSYLGTRMVQDQDTGEEYLSGASSLQKGAVPPLVTVDESSQLPSRLLKSTIDHGAKFLFLGDACQLKPVNEPPCLAIDKARCPWPVVELTTPHRQALNSPILAQATEARLGPVKLRQQLVDGEGVHVLPVKEWVGQWKERLDGPLLPYHNQYCDRANAAARKAKGLDGDYAPGERLVLHSRYQTDDENVLQNGTRFTVAYAEKANVLGLDGYRLHTTDGDVIPVAANYRERQARLDYEKEAAQINATAGRHVPWGGYFLFKNGVADVRPGFAQTVHRSQGGTWENVYIDLRDYANSPERRSLLYVALTRASRNVYLTGL